MSSTTTTTTGSEDQEQVHLVISGNSTVHIGFIFRGNTSTRCGAEGRSRARRLITTDAAVTCSRCMPSKALSSDHNLSTHDRQLLDGLFDELDAERAAAAPVIESAWHDSSLDGLIVQVTPYRTTDRAGEPVEVTRHYQNGGLISSEGHRVKRDGSLYARPQVIFVSIPANVSARIADHIKAQQRTRLVQETARKNEAARAGEVMDRHGVMGCPRGCTVCI